jgi:catechol 2,3-dioxygenase-like lactoylglutathione lyase family enzyme
MIVKLDRVIVAVDDVEAALADYVCLLGREASDAERGLFGLRNTTLQLASVEDLADEGLEVSKPGVAALVFEEDGRDEDQWLPSERTRRIPIALGRDDRDGVDAAAALVKPGTQVDALDHVVVSTGDLDAARRLYGEELGLRLALDRSFEKRGIQILFFRTGGLTVEVVGALAAAARSGDGSSAFNDDRDRFGGLAWEVPDVSAIRARLLNEGFDVSEERVGHKPGTSVCTVRDRTHGVPTLLKGPELG